MTPSPLSTVSMKSSAISGLALDWAVAQCEGITVVFDGTRIRHPPGQFSDEAPYCPSQDWAEGGEILEREAIATRKLSNGLWLAMLSSDLGDTEQASWSEFTYKGAERHGELSYQVTPRMQRFHAESKLVAGLRCYIHHKLGATIDVPSNVAGAA